MLWIAEENEKPLTVSLTDAVVEFKQFLQIGVEMHRSRKQKVTIEGTTTPVQPTNTHSMAHPNLSPGGVPVWA